MSKESIERLASGSLRVRLPPAEAQVLKQVVTDVEGLVRAPDNDPDQDLDIFGQLEQQLAGSSEPPQDPAIRRLFPDAYVDDPEASQDYRRFTENAQRRHKSTRLVQVEQDLQSCLTAGSVDLDESAIDAWLAALNDVRLVVGSRLEISTDDDGELFGPDDPQFPLYSLYQWITWLQYSMLELAD